MNVISNHTYHYIQPKWQQMITSYALPISAVCIMISMIGWIILFLLVQQDQLSNLSIIGQVAIVGGVMGIGLPPVGRMFRKEAEQQQQLFDGQQQLVNMFDAQLDDRWTLLQHLPVSNHIIDAVLIGPTGVYVVVMLCANQPHHNDHEQWLVRDGEQWKPLASNPTIKAIEVATAVQTYLQPSTPVNPRIAWVSRALMLPEEPAVPIWLLNHPEPMYEDIISGMTMIDTDMIMSQLTTLMTVSASSSRRKTSISRELTTP